MREQIAEALNEAVKARDKKQVCTLRLINAAIKDRDIALRGTGKDVVSDIGANSLRDMGKCINTLKKRYPGQMDFCHASGVVKELLR